MTGRFDRQPELIAKMAELQERSHSAFWAFVRTNQAAMEAFYEGDTGWDILSELRRIGKTLDVMFDRIETQTEILRAIRRESSRR